MITLFWHCKECRKRFSAIPFDAERHIKRPRDAVMWWWRAHNTINAQLQTAGDHAPGFPLDPGHPKVQWPPRKLCPRCWKGKSFDEEAVYHFLVTSFYAAPNEKSEEVVQEWTP